MRKQWKNLILPSDLKEKWNPFRKSFADKPQSYIRDLDKKYNEKGFILCYTFIRFSQRVSRQTLTKNNNANFKSMNMKIKSQHCWKISLLFVCLTTFETINCRQCIRFRIKITVPHLYQRFHTIATVAFFRQNFTMDQSNPQADGRRSAHRIINYEKKKDRSRKGMPKS